MLWKGNTSVEHIKSYTLSGCSETRRMVVISFGVALWLSFILTKFQTGGELQGGMPREGDTGLFEAGNSTKMQWLKSGFHVIMAQSRLGVIVLVLTNILFHPSPPCSLQVGMTKLSSGPQTCPSSHTLSRCAFPHPPCSLLFIIWHPAMLQSYVVN